MESYGCLASIIVTTCTRNDYISHDVQYNSLSYVYRPVSVVDVRSWLGDPSIYVLDCSGAGALLPYFIDETEASPLPSPRHQEPGTPIKILRGASMQSFKSSASMTNLEVQADAKCIVLAACKSDEILPLNPAYPLDIFTSCLTTPIPTAIRWFILQNPFSFRDLSPDICENIPGKDTDRKTPRGELHWIFTAITDTIAWDTLPSSMFKKVFRQDLLVASLFRNFLLAKRLMKSLNCTPQVSVPSHTHIYIVDTHMVDTMMICNISLNTC
jgi:regulator-associated protein of mTOR